MNIGLGSLAWRRLSKPVADVRSRLSYLDELTTNLFVSLPDATKRSFVSHAQDVLNYPTFIETGTFLGQMSLHASPLFSSVHTIELSPALAAQAAIRFADVPNVTVHHGDSRVLLPRLLSMIETPCIFWLDGHYSGGITARGDTDTPIISELRAIRDHKVRPHAILVDDIRLFGTDDAYPTLEEVIGLLRDIDPRFKIGVTSDIIWASPTRILRFEWRLSPSGLVVPPRTTSSCRPRAVAGAGKGPAGHRRVSPIDLMRLLSPKRTRRVHPKGQ
jgi:hypothetical protein